MATIPYSLTEVPDFLPLRRFSTDDYLHMIEAGVLGPQDHVELINGVIVEMSPAGTVHNYVLLRLNQLFSSMWGEALIAIQGTLTVSEGQVYDPDFLLLRPRPEGYKSRLPDASDVLLVIEASDSSLRRDRQVKLPVYAVAGIAEYWIADIENESIIMHRYPQGKSYQSVSTYRGDDVVTPLAAPQISMPVRSVFN